MSTYYDRSGAPLTIEEWMPKFSDKAYQRVAQDEIKGVTISTVWLGLDHGRGEGDPVFFETMTFANGGDECWSDWCWRYCNEQQAVDGHALVCAAVRRGAAPESVPMS